MTEFRIVQDAGAEGSLFCWHGKRPEEASKHPIRLFFTIGGFSPRIGNGFAPPADNIHSHRDSSKPGYDDRCTDADPVPARFSLICEECGRGYIMIAGERDLRVSPQMILDQLAQAIEANIKKLVIDPAVQSRLGRIAYTAALEELRRSGLADLLAEIPARGAGKAETKFCAQFIPLPAGEQTR